MPYPLFFSNEKAGNIVARLFSRASRFTFARMDAAAIEHDQLSPFAAVIIGLLPIVLNPRLILSVKIKSIFFPSCISVQETNFFTAMAVALLIPTLSTSQGSIETVFADRLCFLIHSDAVLRFFSEINFESWSISCFVPGSSTTQPSTRGPSSGPRPTSSMPQTTFFSAQDKCSN